MNPTDWINAATQPPPVKDIGEILRGTKPYVLAVDAKGRMSVGYPYKYSTGELGWVFAKPIGAVTHWMPLPEPPMTDDDKRDADLIRQSKKRGGSFKPLRQVLLEIEASDPKGAGSVESAPIQDTPRSNPKS